MGRTRRDLPIASHGGIWQEANAEALLERGVLDFSANVNPYGPPAGVRRILRGRLRDLELYPDPEPRRLTRDLARRLRVPTDCVLLGAGATEILFAAAAAHVRAGTRVVLPRHTYGEYEANAVAFGARIRKVPMPGLRVDPAQLAESLEADVICFLCNPNNPTGQYIRAGELRPLFERAEDVGALLVVDEALADFVRTRDDLVPLATRRPSLLLVRSFTKLFGLPGIRLGYAVGHPVTIRHLRPFRPPWGVSALAERVGQAALRETDFVERSVERIGRERQRLLDHIPGFPGEANYLLIDVDNARRVKRALLRANVYVRDCTSFGLPHHVRVAVRRPAENDRLLAALRRLRLSNP